MSAIVAVETSDSVVMLTDGAIYDTKSVLLDVRRKVLVSEKMPLAIAGRGHTGLGDYAAKLIMKLIEDVGFDAGTAAAESILKQFGPLSGIEHFELIIAGMSEEYGPRHVQMRTDRSFSFNREQSAISSATSGAAPSEMGLPPRSPDEGLEHYLCRVGADMFNFYRRHVGRPDDGYVVGGQVDLTIVSRTGVTVETIHRWDDKIGELINPFAERKTVTPFAGLNRQQRRQAERDQRRRAA